MKLDDALKSVYRWNKLTLTLHRLNSPEMKTIAEIFENTPVPSRIKKGNTRREMEKSLVAKIQIADECVYILYSSYLPLKAVLEGLVSRRSTTKQENLVGAIFGKRDSPRNCSPAGLAFKIAYNRNGYYWAHPTAKLITEALKARMTPSTYVLLHKST